MKTYRIAVVEGDGIGPEVIASASEVLAAAQRPGTGFELDFRTAPAGAGTYLEQGEALPVTTLETCRERRRDPAGRCGLPGVRYPDGTEIIPQVTLRIVLDLYAGVRPAYRLAGIASPLAGSRRSTSWSSARIPRGSSPRSGAGSCSATR